MRILLDTHTLLWWAHNPGKLSDTALNIITDGETEALVSAVSAMEIATKSRKGKLEYDSALAHRFVQEVSNRGFEILAISADHAERAGGYTSDNQDPWDRLIAAQAELEGLTLVSCDGELTAFGIKPLW